MQGVCEVEVLGTDETVLEGLRPSSVCFCAVWDRDIVDPDEFVQDRCKERKDWKEFKQASS